MGDGCRILGLLLRKNFIVRKRHWLMTAFEIVLPVALFGLFLSLRGLVVSPPVHVENSTYYPIETDTELLATVDRRMTNVYFVPQNDFTVKIMKAARACLALPIEKVIGFRSEDDMLKAYTLQQIKELYSNVLAVVFEDVEGSSSPKHLKYTIRTSKWLPSKPFYSYSKESVAASQAFSYEIPFVQVQMCLDKSFVRMAAPNLTFDAQMSIQQMPYPAYEKVDETDTAVKEFFSLTATIVFMATLLIEATFVAKEKHIGVNVLMAMNGVRLDKNLLSWLISGMLLSVIYISVITVLFKFCFSAHISSYLYYGNGFIFWLMLIINIAHVIAFGLHVASYFSKPQFMQGAIVTIYLVMTVIHNLMLTMNLQSFIPFLGILLPNMMIRRMFDEVNIYESKLTGIQWNNLFITGNSSFDRTNSLGCVMIFSILGIILHFFLVIYVLTVCPGKYGVPKHPLFFLERRKKNKICSEDETKDFVNDNMDKQQFETVVDGVFTPGIQIRNLKKIYTSWTRKTTVDALKGISLDFYKGQITALLGHNGAGKTTMMSILTGLTGATEGTVFINGKNLKDELDTIRTDIGLCPQENMFFPDLTVFEQIEFFGLLKGRNKTGKQITDKVNSLLSKLGLFCKKDIMPNKLSGGEKRRLCLGMALIGDANVLILDEPTSGMDPESRRDTWDIILKMRGQKTIMISTHSMEEADILGDRIAIMHTGQMKSYGTSMFLKKLYGHGYQEVALSIESWCSPEKIRNLIDANAELHSLDSGRMVLSVPYTDSFPKTLDILESRKKELGVTGISVSIITLEQVFLKITKEEEDDTVDQSEQIVAPSIKLSGWRFVMQVIFALLAKKITYITKNLSILWVIMLAPLIPILLMALIDNVTNDLIVLSPLRLDVYDFPQALYSTANETFGLRYKKIIESLNGVAQFIEPGINLTNVLLDVARKDIGTYHNNLIVSAEFNVHEQVVHANGFYSSIGALSIPITVNLLSNTLIKTLAGDEYQIDVSSQVLPNSLASTMMDAMETFGNSILKTILFSAVLFITVGLFVVHPLQESSTGIKQLQRMTGVTSSLYWGTMFVSDMFVISCSILLIIAGLYGIDAAMDIRLYRGTEIGITALLLFLFVISALPLVYIHSFLKKTTNTILTILYLVPLMLVIVEIIMYGTFKNIQNHEILKMFRFVQQKIFHLIPHVSFSFGHMFFLNTAAQNARCRRLPNRLNDVACLGGDLCCGLECYDGTCKNSLPYFTSFVKESSLKECLIYLVVTPFVIFTILGLLEHRIFLKFFARIRGSALKTNTGNMDEDVRKEKHIVALEINKRKIRGNYKNGQRHKENSNRDNLSVDSTSEDVFLVYELSKNYGNLAAVKEVNFRVRKHECFGLLGVNGAGKSTTFRMLTGEEIPSSGILFLGENSINANRKEYLAQMGYCPQTDALIRSLNAWDHLRLFARLRGIPKSEVNWEVKKWINKLNLNSCAMQPSGSYSGGNKRRLNIAIALIGSPSMVLLDEPTTGVDPAARRLLWNVLRSCQTAGQAIIFTSHSMEECEALCNRLVIMVEGELVCIGPSEQLKQRFGAGYDIDIKLNPGRSDTEVQNIKMNIEAALVCELRDENSGFLSYHVTDSKTTWQKMFETMNDLKCKFNCIEDFSVLSSTLEQLFIQFARNAKESKSEKDIKNSVKRLVPI